MLLLLTIACKAEFPPGDTAILPPGLTPNIEVDRVFPGSANECGYEGICLTGRGFEGELTVTVGGQPCEPDSVRAYDLDPSAESWFSDHVSCELAQPEAVGENTVLPVELSRDGEVQGSAELIIVPVRTGECDTFDLGLSGTCCTLDYPATLELGPGETSTTLQARVDPSADQVNLTLQLGWGPKGSNPADGCWTWTDAQAIGGGEFPGETVYQGTLTAPPWPGEYVVAARASESGGVWWQYCDMGEYQQSCVEAGGSLTGYSESNTVTMRVE